jgi:hypothetical protein
MHKNGKHTRKLQNIYDKNLEKAEDRQVIQMHTEANHQKMIYSKYSQN